ncbi:MAG: MogA/MoaB family molybdenum cofactor biosynthesis protein [Desulfohalobiaceae bacterium]|nr:MogA/MoaB family molybdenum cofactor biosynthesis protein [Desulfohalobiaceae bacterium]
MLTISAETPVSLSPGQTAILCPGPAAIVPGQLISRENILSLPAGTSLGSEEDSARLQAAGSIWLPGPEHARRGFVLRVLTECSFGPDPICLQAWRKNFSLAWVTLRDKGARGERTDESGPIIPELVQAVLPLDLAQGFILPDDEAELKGLLVHLALEEKYDLIVTSGGTGAAPRDITPEVTASILEKDLPGFEQAMVRSSLDKTPHGMISRARAGLLGTSLIINLPGSPKGVRENLTALLPALRHTLDKVRGDQTDCAI